MLIQFGIINYKLILPFIYPFFFQLIKFIHKDDKRPFYEFFTSYLGYLSHGIVYVIILKRMEKRKESFSITNDNEKIIRDSTFELVVLDETKQSFHTKTLTFHQVKTKVNNQLDIDIAKLNSRLTKKKYIYLLLLTLIYLVPMFLDSYCSINDELNFTTGSSMSLFFCIISYVVLGRIILGYKIYRHQIFSLTFIIICNILIIILILIDKKNISNIAVNILIMVTIYILYALYNTLEKRYFNIHMDSPYHYMFVIGLISTIIILLYETITVLAFGKDNPFNGIFQQIEKNFGENNFYILIFLGDIILSFLFVGGINLTIYFFTPCHIIILEGIRHIISSIFDNSYAEYPLYIQIIVYILFFIIFFASLIYNEIILIKVFDLDKNTAKNIEKRANLDNEIKISVDDIESNRITLNDKITDDK